MMICGGAAINPEVLEGLTAFGPTALQGYGLTEASPIGALKPDTKPNSGSIGRKLPGFDIKIVNTGEDGIGEICLKGDNIMLGYYNRPELDVYKRQFLKPVQRRSTMSRNTILLRKCAVNLKNAETIWLKK